MKKNIHPKSRELIVNCSCGNIIKIFSTLNKNFSIEVCYKCHSFYTGKQKSSNIKGRLEKFNKKYKNINYLFSFNKEKK